METLLTLWDQHAVRDPYSLGPPWARGLYLWVPLSHELQQKVLALDMSQDQVSRGWGRGSVRRSPLTGEPRGQRLGVELCIHVESLWQTGCFTLLCAPKGHT